MQRFFAVVFAVTLAVVAIPFVSAQYNEYRYQFDASSTSSSRSAVPVGDKMSSSAQSLHPSAEARAFRPLWMEQAVWMREYVVSMTIGSPAVPSQAQRLVNGNRELGAALGAMVGQEAGDRLTELLNEHMAIATRRMEAAGSGNEDEFTLADAQWRQNAEAIARHLAQSGDAWSEAVLQSLLQQRMDLMTQVAIARLENDWEGDVTAFDAIIDNATAIADVMESGMQPVSSSSSSNPFMSSSSSTPNSGLFGPGSSSSSSSRSSSSGLFGPGSSSSNSSIRSSSGLFGPISSSSSSSSSMGNSGLFGPGSSSSSQGGMY